MDKIIYNVDTSNGIAAKMSENLINGRKNVVRSRLNEKQFDSEVTILVQAYNRLEKTKECISSILKYTSNVNYDLLLIDNGSTDDTLEYFKSIDYDKVRILHLSKNVSSLYPLHYYDIEWFSDYFVTLSSDIIVTHNWLSNLLITARSDDKIGMVNPVSSNVSNYQSVDIEFKNIEDMHNKAQHFNVSDPSKWHERLRMITLGTLYKKECLYAIGWPLADVGFFHDFSDDDITFRVRRSGYKAILAKDTWIHHNHDVFNMENKTPQEYQKSLEVGRNNFKEKYYGIDAWIDVGNFIPHYISAVRPTSDKKKSILGIDVRCGTPVLEIKNHLRKYNMFDCECSAYTQDAKYYIDLQTVCGMKNVYSENINSLYEKLYDNQYDYIVIGENINTYEKPYKVINDSYNLLKTGGQLFISLKNTYDIYAFLNLIGNTNIYNSQKSINYSPEEFCSYLTEKYKNVQFLKAVQYNEEIIKPDIYSYTVNKINAINVDDPKEILNRMLTDNFLFCIEKV